MFTYNNALNGGVYNYAFRSRTRSIKTEFSEVQLSGVAISNNLASGITVYGSCIIVLKTDRVL